MKKGNINTRLFLIITTEFFERYYFYSLRSILYPFLLDILKFSNNDSKKIIHTFFIFTYSSSFFFALISDSFLGQFKTIIFSNFLYLTGAVLCYFGSFYKSSYYFLTGLLFISIGTGGIKSNISNFGASQLSEEQGIKNFFSIFYFVINLGAILSILITPIISKLKCNSEGNCYNLVFIISLCLIVASQVIFVSGSKIYKKKKISSKNIKNIVSDSNLKFIKSILKVFLPIAFFWMLFDQQSTSWIEQGNEMEQKVYKLEILPVQMQLLNAGLILVLIPLLSKFLLNKKSNKNSQIKIMSLGIFLSSMSFICAYTIEKFLENDIKLNILFQFFQYFFISVSEVFVSITGLEYAYTSSPAEIKSIITALWHSTTALGNLLTVIITSFLLIYRNSTNFLVFAIFGVLASFFLQKNNF